MKYIMAKKQVKKLAIAVDLGGTKLRVAIVNCQGKVLKKIEALTARRGKSGEVITDQIVRLVKKISVDFELRNFSGIGISGAGPQDQEKGAIVKAPNMAFGYIPLTKPISEEFGSPVYLLNDGSAGALGEKCFGLGKKAENLIYITISSGIGGGAIVNGSLLLGRNGNAVEIGHMVVDTSYSLLCSCKKGRGHWEAYASGNNIPKFFRVWAEKNRLKTEFPSRAKDIFEQARERNKIILKFMEELGRINGRGISNVIAAYNPELIVLSGAVALNNFNWIVKYAKPNIDRFLKKPKIIKSSLREDAPLLGAAAMVFRVDRKVTGW